MTKIHLRWREDYQGTTVCGNWVKEGNSTRKLEEVTCQRCLRPVDQKAVADGSEADIAWLKKIYRIK